MPAKRNYESVAQAAYEAAMDESFAMPLRQWYAKLALWADKKAQTAGQTRRKKLKKFT